MSRNHYVLTEQFSDDVREMLSILRSLQPMANSLDELDALIAADSGLEANLETALAANAADLKELHDKVAPDLQPQIAKMVARQAALTKALDSLAQNDAQFAPSAVAVAGGATATSGTPPPVAPPVPATPPATALPDPSTGSSAPTAGTTTGQPGINPPAGVPGAPNPGASSTASGSTQATGTTPAGGVVAPTEPSTKPPL